MQMLFNPSTSVQFVIHTRIVSGLIIKYCPPFHTGKYLKFILQVPAREGQLAFNQILGSAFEDDLPTIDSALRT